MGRASQHRNSTSNNILLDAGTNELEVLVFTMGGGEFGINVAKVREVIRNIEVVESPDQHPAVRGIFNLRKKLVTLIDLPKFLKMPTKIEEENRKIIVTEFNDSNNAFLVENVERIFRISWDQIRSQPNDDTELESWITGVAEIDERLIQMIDFESVLQAVAPNREFQETQVGMGDHEVDRSNFHVVLVDDSSTIRKMMRRTLERSGYTRVTEFANGKLAWDALNASVKEGRVPCDIVISDIEMPKMDGLHLTKRIKENELLKDVPVIVFSSLISPDTQHKAQSVGANEQIAKPHLTDMVQLADKWLSDKVPWGK